MPAIASLRCSNCGSSEPLSAAARRDGWYRCGSCATPSATPISRLDACEGPESGIVLLREAGRARFVTPPGSVLATTATLAAIFFAWNAAFLFAGTCQLNLPGHFLRAVGAPALFLLAALCSLLAIRARLAEQHVIVDRRRIAAQRCARRFVWRRRECEHAGRELEIAAEQCSDPWGRSAWRTTIRIDGSVFQRIPCSGEREARWLERMIRLAATGEETAGPGCSGCGAPLDVNLEVRGAGHLSCDYCRAGYHIDGLELKLDPLRIPDLSTPRGAAPPEVIEARAGKRLTLDVELPGRLARRAGALGQLVSVAFFAVATWVVWSYVLPAAREDDAPPALVAYLLTGGWIFVGLAALTLYHAARAAYGRTRIELTAGCVQIHERIGPFPALALFTRGAPRTRRAALLRLLAVRFEGVGGPTTLELVSPIRTIRVTWGMSVESDRWLRARVVGEIRHRLGPLERECAGERDVFDSELVKVTTKSERFPHEGFRPE